MERDKNSKNQEMSEVLKEVRRIRHEISAEFGHDPQKFGDYCRELEQELRKSGKYKFADLPEDKQKSKASTRGEAAD